MKEFFAALYPTQNLPEGAREGLPYWILWLLMCIIFLLVTFIFLRDKDLRRRLDSFFFGIKKKLTKVRLQSMLKREGQKHEDFLRELGQKAWAKKIPFKAGKNIDEKLAQLEKAEAEYKKEITDIKAEVSSLRKNLGEISLKLGAKKQDLESESSILMKDVAEIEAKEKDIETHVLQRQAEYEEAVKKLNLANKNIYDADDDGELSEEDKTTRKDTMVKEAAIREKERKEIDKKIRGLIVEKTKFEKEITQKKTRQGDCSQEIKQVEEEKKDEIRKFQKEIREWEKNREKIHDKIQHLEKQMSPLFYNLGKLINEARIKHKELVILYSRIDRSQKRRKEIEGQIKNLK